MTVDVQRSPVKMGVLANAAKTRALMAPPW
jgi:hypothetical protein